MANEKDYLKMTATLRLDYLKLKLNTKNSQDNIKVKHDKLIYDRKNMGGLTESQKIDNNHVKTRSVFPSVSNIKILYSRGNSLSNAEELYNKGKTKEKEFQNISKRLKNQNLANLNIKELITSNLKLPLGKAKDISLNKKKFLNQLPIKTTDMICNYSSY
jgi:hypothetical protein